MSKIKKITKEYYDGYVYNVEVENNHNYFADNILVSNCHENSSVFGEHGDILSPSFLDNLHPYTELAIGGGNPLEHPDLLPFLLKCEQKHFIPSMTVNQVHFEKYLEPIQNLCDNKLIYGLGVSLVSPTKKFIKEIKEFPNAVIHVINGIVTEEELRILKDNNLKVLVLGYKKVRRGVRLYDRDSSKIDGKISEMKNLLPTILKEKWFDVISFDNLALKQLEVKNCISDDVWKKIYMGDDGLDGEQTSCSMFVDMVERKFAKNSCAMQRYDLLDTAEDMFNYLRNR